MPSSPIAISCRDSVPALGKSKIHPLQSAFRRCLDRIFLVRLSARRQARREINAPAGKLGLYSRVLRSLHVEFGLATGRAAASIVHLACHLVSRGRYAGCVQVNLSARPGDLADTRMPDKSKRIAVRITGCCHDVHPIAQMNCAWTYGAADSGRVIGARRHMDIAYSRHVVA